MSNITTPRRSSNQPATDSKDSTWQLERVILEKIHPLRGPRKPPPVFPKEAALPALSQWSCHRFVLLHALWPIAVQGVYILASGGRSLPYAVCVGLYIFAYINMMLREASHAHRIGKRVGFLDGDVHSRDRVPPDGAGKVLTTVALFAFTRPCLTIIVSGRTEFLSLPALYWSLPVELFLYPIVLDFWFYIYHRACHESNVLWKYHRTHHLTKHPIPLLASFSDIEQEIIEVVAVPLATYFTLKWGLGMPMSFHSWTICQAYILFEEVMAHSGLRIYAVAPSLASWFLEMFDCELVIEDHDLHHRHGWRKSYNYGKQTRLWDRVFGTVKARIESDHVDYNDRIDMQWF